VVPESQWVNKALPRVSSESTLVPASGFPYFIQRLESELNLFDCLILQYRLDFIGGAPYFSALGHILVHPSNGVTPLFRCLSGGSTFVREASGADHFKKPSGAGDAFSRLNTPFLQR
jgi:hypothetical protein